MSLPPAGGAIRSMLAAVRAAPLPLRHAWADQPVRPVPFVTISREGGAGGRAFGQALVNRLNAIDPKPSAWTLWDRQLVEKTSADHRIAAELIESLGEAGRTWMEDFLAGLNFASDETEAHVYQAVATTIRLLAHKGRAVIVGRGGVYITRNLPGGIHVRLIAPIDARVRNMSEQLHISLAEASAHVHQLDRQRQAFYRRYWPREVLTAEAFTLTLNTAMVSEDQAVQCVIPLILPRPQSAGQDSVPEPELAAK